MGLATHPSHSNFLGVISLFGFMTHNVILAEGYQGSWPDLPIAHLYNLKTGRAAPFPRRKEPLNDADS
jgi:hypothetical protein